MPDQPERTTSTSAATVSRDWLRKQFAEELQRRLCAADIGRWQAPSGSTGLTVVGIAADLAVEVFGAPSKSGYLQFDQGKSGGNLL